MYTLYNFHSCNLFVSSARLKADYKNSYVPVGPNAVIRTFSVDSSPCKASAVSLEGEKLPLVMIHGFGAGFLQFYKNLDHLSVNRRLLAIDLPGFGRSTRVSFSTDAQRAEEEFVDSIESWRKRVGVERFILLGHSLGAFIACSYSMKYPMRVRHLILVDPWGVDTAPPPEELQKNMSRTGDALWRVASKFKPFDAVRAAGPWGGYHIYTHRHFRIACIWKLKCYSVGVCYVLGPNLVKHTRPDLQRRFGDDFMEYVYHCNAQKPT